MKVTMEPYGQWMWTVSILLMISYILETDDYLAVQTRFLVSGSADNTLRLWQVSNGKCLFTWEFPTAVKRVAFNEEGSQIVCITEQRMGHQCAIRVFDINTQDGNNRM